MWGTSWDIYLWELLVRFRLRDLMFFSVLTVFLVAGAAPAGANFSNGPSSAGIVERFDGPGFAVFADPDELGGVFVLANLNSVADACNGIPAGPGDVQELSLPGDVTIQLVHDDDVPVIVIPLADPEVICADPDNWPIIATGSGDVRAQDNDLFGSRTRTNAFGLRLTGSVVDGDGGLWNIQAHFRAHVDQNGEFVANERVNLVSRG